jgi:hypothetical protein
VLLSQPNRRSSGQRPRAEPVEAALAPAIIAALMSPSPLTDSEIRFAGRAIRRGRLFLALAWAGVSIAIALSVFYGYRRWTDPGFPVGPRAVIVLLILLNARQNLRQYRYASLLRKLGDLRGPGGNEGLRP